MQRVVLFAFLSILSAEFSISLQAGEPWWEKKQYLQWSDEEVYSILHDSPWAQNGIAGTLHHTDHYKRPMSPPGATSAQIAADAMPTVRDIIIRYHVRVLTSRPVREAFYRISPEHLELWTMFANRDIGTLSDAEDIQKPSKPPWVVDVKDLLKAKSAEKEKVMSASPNGPPILKAAEKYIMIGVTLDQHGAEIDPEDRSQLMKTSRLRTDTGKSVDVVGFKTAWAVYGWIEYQCYFPRYLPDGQSLVDASTENVWLEAKIDDLKIRAKFKPKKMLYKGKLEM